MKDILIVFISLSLFVSCVSNKKILYMQNKDVNNKEPLKDTVLRTYRMNVDEYRIQPLDILSIRVESLTTDEFDFIKKLYPTQQNLSGQNPILTGFLIDEGGNVEFPVVGKIKLSGMTVFQSQEILKKSFEPFLKNPVVRVQLLNFRFTVLGEVNGEKQINSQNTRITFMEAIGLAGGLTDLADRANVKVIRQAGDRSEIFYVDLLQENILESSHYYVQQNDIIIIPPLRQRPFRKYGSQNIAILLSSVSLILLTINLASK